MITIIRADARRLPLPDACADLIVTSPPYFGLRSYTDGGEHYAGQIGSEATLAEYLAALLECTAEWARVLKPSGSIFVNLGDKYSGAQAQNYNGVSNRGAPDSAEFWRRTDPKRTGIPNKSLMGLPWRYALACTDQLGLILRRDIIWHKPNGLPESVTDRCRSSHEYVFHLVRQPRYYSAVDEIREPAENPTSGTPSMARPWPSNGEVRYGSKTEQRYHPLGKLPGSVWTIPSQPLTIPPALGLDHFAAFPMELPRRIILGWSPPGVCIACGHGRRPVTDKRLVGVWHDKPAQNSHHLGSVSEHKHHLYGVKETFGSTSATITGYACACDQPTAPTRPALIVDPFGGTGTTALVASVNGRHGITADMSADYCRIAQWRTTDPGEKAAAMQVPRPPAIPDGQEPLFAYQGDGIT